jgi:hypothetical protein
MKKIFLLAIVLGAFVAATAQAAPESCECFGGYDFESSPSYWYLLDYDGYPLEDGDCVCVYWTGPDGLISPPDPATAPAATGDDVQLNCGVIDYGVAYVVVTTYAVGDGVHPEAGETIYMRIFDGPCASLDETNYYADSDLYAVTNSVGEYYEFSFPGDPRYGYTDTPLPVELTSFAAIARDGEVLLEWKTASESNLLGFYIERDDNRISELIEGHGNSATEQTYTYLDKDVENGVSYSYNLITVDLDGIEMVANEEPVSATPAAHVPTAFALHQNYPNPFNPVTEIKYDVPKNTHVTLKVYNVLGAEVATLVDADQKANFYTVSWDARDLASGVYFCTLTAGDFKAVKKMVLLK